MSLETSIIEGAWVLLGIESPMLVVLFYRRIDSLKLASPLLVVPGMAGLSVFLFLFYPAHLLYGHFLVDGGLFIAVYLWLIFKQHYRSTDSFVLTTCALIASDQLWQVPLFAYDWLLNPVAMAASILPSFLALTSIPLFFYVLMFKAKRKVKIPGFPFAMAFGWTVIATEYYRTSPPYDWGLFFLWMAMFLTTLRESSQRPASRIAEAPLEERAREGPAPLPLARLEGSSSPVLSEDATINEAINDDSYQ